MMNKQRKTSNLLNILDYNDSGSITTTGSITATSFTGSLFGTSSYTLNGVSASYAVSSSYTETASYAPAYLPLTGGTINGDIVLNGTASIAFLDVTYQSSSIIYSSGSNQFGDASDDVQTLMGTVIVTGSQQITGSLNVSQGVTGSFTGSFTGDGSQLTNLPISQLIREEFTWTSGSSQTFQLLSSASQVYSVEVQGQGALSSTQYNTTTSSIEILNQLEDNDYITVLYSSGPVASNPYYTQGQVDTLLSSKLDKDFSSLPTASLPLSGSEELAIIQDGETKKAAVSEIKSKRTYIIPIVIPTATTATSNWLTFPREGVSVYSTSWANENAYDPTLDTHLNARCLKWIVPFKCKLIEAYWEYSTLATPLTINIFTGRLNDNSGGWYNGKTIASKIMPIGVNRRFQIYTGTEIDTTYEMEKYDAITIAVNNGNVSTGTIRTNVLYLILEEV